MELIDSHAHLTFDELAGSLADVLQRSTAAGVCQSITIGTDPQQNKKVVSLIDKFENIYGSVGIHPHYAADISAEDIKEIAELAENKKVVAIGEAGLDFYYKPYDYNAQKLLLEKQLQIASDTNLALIIHSRDAFDETMEIVNNFSSRLNRVVFHCFGGTVEQAEIVLDKGFYISFTGVVTFKNAETARNVAKMVPLDRMMIETDCPFMSPAPMRKQKPNEPALLVHTAKKIAELKNTTLEEFAQAVTKTTRQFFDLPAVS